MPQSLMEMRRAHGTAHTMDKHGEILLGRHTMDMTKTAPQQEHGASVSYHVLPEKFVSLVLAWFLSR
jgi:hypothetical protein